MDSRAPLRAGIAGSLSGIRRSHARLFRAAHQGLTRHGVSTVLGDDGSCPEQARLLARRFFEAGVTVVIGHFNSACARAVIPLYRAHGITLLLPACTDIGLALGAGVHRLCGDDTGQARAIAERVRQLRRRDPQLAVTVRIDGSDYAHRLLACLHRQLDGFAVAGLDAALGGPSRLDVVVATAAQASAQVRATAQHGAARITIYSDEAAVPEFARAARASRAERYVVTPQPSYAALLAQGCAYIAAMADAPESSAATLAALRPGSWLLQRCPAAPVAACEPTPAPAPVAGLLHL